MSLEMVMKTSSPHICQNRNGVAAVQLRCPDARIWRDRLIAFARMAWAYGLAATHTIFPS